MGLVAYEEVSVGVYTAYSIDGLQTNPLTTVHHGRNGDTFETQLYAGRESGDSSTYTNVRVKPDSLTLDADIGSGSTPGTSGWGVKLMVDPGHTPTESEWDATDYGTTIDLANISDDSKLPFWFRIESPRGEDVKNKTNIALYLMYTETP